MKQKLLNLKSWLLMMCLLVGVGNAWAANFELVASAPSDWSGTYVLVGNGNGNNKVYAFSGVDVAYGSSEIKVTDGVIYDYKGSTLVVEALTDGGYSVKVVGGENDGKYISSGSSAPTYANALKFTENPHRVDFSMDDGGNVVMAQTIEGSGTVTMRFNYASDQLRFRFYKSGQQPVKLYRLSDASDIAVTGISLNKESLELMVGKSETLVATIAPQNATNKNVVWVSNNDDVATVDDNGKVTAVAEGTTTITAVSEDGEFEATCEVTVTPYVEPDELQIIFAANSTNSDSGSAWDKTSNLTDVFAEGANFVSEITATSNVYPARNSLVNGAKFGTSDKVGTITFTLSKAVNVEKIVVSAAAYGDSEGQDGFTINGTNVPMTSAQNKVYAEYEIEMNGEEMSSITISQNKASKGRIYVEGITIVKATPVPTKGTVEFVAEGRLPIAGWEEQPVYFATFSCDKDVIFDLYDESGAFFAVAPVGFDDEDGTLSFPSPDESTAFVTDEEIGAVTGHYVPANTGVLLVSFDKQDAPYYYVVEDEDNELEEIDPDGLNLLRAASVAKTGDFKFYKLAYEDESMEPSSLGFYYGAADGAAFESREGSAYLAVPAELANVKGFRFVTDDATAIKNVENNKVQTNAVYNLAGQRVAAKDFKGIVIKNGKKMLNK